MALTIYGTARSRTARVLWMAKELGLQFEHVPLMMGDGALKQPSFLRINPAGRVPAIDDDGFVMAESLAINLHLARKYGDRATPSLAPASLEEEAKIWQWSSWAMTDLEVPLNLIHLHRNFFPPEKRDRKVAETAEAQVQRPLAMLNSTLTDSAYLLGDRFTVADINVASVLSASRLSAISMAPLPHVADWAKRCQGPPAALAVQAMREAGL
ncbi:MAG TPA: glutathione S-transferase family protein [Dongiaceae bacterium]|nr:glutathione S-transferase family protein [Dongiaceae bacterium]